MESGELRWKSTRLVLLRVDKTSLPYCAGNWKVHHRRVPVTAHGCDHNRSVKTLCCVTFRERLHHESSCSSRAQNRKKSPTVWEQWKRIGGNLVQVNVMTVKLPIISISKSTRLLFSQDHLCSDWNLLRAGQHLVYVRGEIK